LSDQDKRINRRSAAFRRPPIATTIGDRIRKFRVERGLSQDFVAGRSAISTGWFLRIENGQVEPRFAHVVAIASALGVDLGQLVADESFDQPLQPSAGRGAAVEPTVDLERLHRARQRPATIDEPFLDHLESFLRWYWSAYHTTAPTLLLPPVAAHVTSLWPLVDETLGETIARALRSLIGNAASLAGWLALRLGNRASSSVYWSLAEALATEAEDQVLRRFALASRSSLYTNTLRGGEGGDPALALAFLDAAAGHDAGLPPIQRAWTFARRAEEHAARGDRDSVERDLDRAAGHLADVRDRPGGYFAAWDMAQLAGYRGSCATLLGGPEAIRLLEDSLAETNPALISQRTAVLANLGSAHTQLGHVDEACAALAEAVTIARSTDLAVSIERVRGIRLQLDRWSAATAVRRLDELIGWV
jgi:transcriptional regulator with XRE-family HTH domain